MWSSVGWLCRLGRRFLCFFDLAFECYPRSHFYFFTIHPKIRGQPRYLRFPRKLDEAIASYHRALAIKPDYTETHNNLGNVLKDQGKLDEAVSSYHRALAIKPNYADAGRNLLLVLLYVPGLSPEELFAEHLRFSENHTRGIPRLAEDLTNDPSPERRLRVGYLSSDPRNHPVGHNI